MKTNIKNLHSSLSFLIVFFTTISTSVIAQNYCRSFYFVALGPDCYGRNLQADPSASRSILIAIAEVCKKNSYPSQVAPNTFWRAYSSFYCSDVRDVPNSVSIANYAEKRHITDFKNIETPTGSGMYQMYFKFPVNNKERINGAFHLHFFIKSGIKNPFVPIFKTPINDNGRFDNLMDQIYLSFPKRSLKAVKKIEDAQSDDPTREFNMQLNMFSSNLKEMKCSIHESFCDDYNPSAKKPLNYNDVTNRFIFQKFMVALEEFSNLPKKAGIVNGVQRSSNRSFIVK
ncbi:MAG: hypothetical protein QE271_04810 [Bacteriovoracaceae bacterium]|nr:hypothetical protein [Bacteriovoracaceae bacterium]